MFIRYWIYKSIKTCQNIKYIEQTTKRYNSMYFVVFFKKPRVRVRSKCYSNASTILLSIARFMDNLNIIQYNRDQISSGCLCCQPTVSWRLYLRPESGCTFAIHMSYCWPRSRLRALRPWRKVLSNKHISSIKVSRCSDRHLPRCGATRDYLRPHIVLHTSSPTIFYFIPHFTELGHITSDNIRTCKQTS